MADKLKLTALVNSVQGFAGWSHSAKIALFGWFLHSVHGQERFSGTEIGNCYDALSLEKPSSISPFLASMNRRTPKQLLRDGRGWFMERQFREQHDAKYGTREITVQVTKLLEELPALPSLAEQDFLREALICYRHGAFRAAQVMCWNLAYAHLLEFILGHHLAAFNVAYPARLAKKHKDARVQTMATYDDFSADLKESEVIEVCKSANIVSSDVHKVLIEKLGKRNSAAHPSTLKVTQLQAEAFVDDLVHNVVLKLAI